MTALCEWLWFILACACIVWYSTITVYVAVKGALDIKHMLARLKAQGEGGGEG